jgi:hypothetical protein
MAVIGLASLGSTDRPEVGDPEVVTDLVGESNEAVEKADKDKANKEPDDKSNTTKPVKDATHSVTPSQPGGRPGDTQYRYLNGKRAVLGPKDSSRYHYESSSGTTPDTLFYDNPK